jgi:uncharacterized protein YggE
MKEQNIKGHNGGIGIVGIIMVLVLLIFVLPFRSINWGKINVGQDKGITVVGEASSREKNQIALFNVGVSIKEKVKEKAVNEVNEKINQVIKDLKKFGIDEDDIKTERIIIYEEEVRVNRIEMYEEEKNDAEEKFWQVSNSIEVVLREVDRVNDLADLLAEGEATNVYGPNLRMDDTSEVEKILYNSAINDAREKAELIAKASGRKLGKVLSVVEGVGSIRSNYEMALTSSERMVGASIEPGMTMVNKSLVVIFELK